jgi:lipoprotein-anchoring transpeptidase ErfK/SrfK
MRFSLSHAALVLGLLVPAACMGEAENDSASPAAETGRETVDADPLAARDPSPGETANTSTPDADPRALMQAQVVLERLGFGTGIIDGEQGPSFANALKGFQESRALAVTGELDAPTRAALTQWNSIPATRVVTIPAAWGETAYPLLPDGMAAKAMVARLGYESLTERLAERFHTTPEVLAGLNPGGRPAGPESGAVPSPDPQAPVQFTAGQQVRVPNVGADAIDATAVENKEWLETLRSLGVGSDQPEVARILVDESEGWLKAFDASGKLVAMFTVTTGSARDPLPIGNWQVKGVAYNPPYAFDPELFWDVPDSAEKQRLAPGPNSPVGVVWIDLTKQHYGIHGTPAPEAIGQSESHGCVRLTNWEAARLAQMVSGRTKVEFRE